jgi:hypothetical protein
MQAVDNVVVTNGGTTIPGYNRDPIDLNWGAGGEYIYLSYQLVENPFNPITDLTVIWGDSPDIHAPAGYEKINHDLNAGSGGKWIYFCTRRGGPDAPVRDLKIIAGDNADVQPEAGWERIPVDLNAGAGGKFIYVCQRR